MQWEREGLDAHRTMTSDDTEGSVWTVAGPWGGFARSRGAARGKFVDFHVKVRGDGRILGVGESERRYPCSLPRPCRAGAAAAYLRP